MTTDQTTITGSQAAGAPPPARELRRSRTDRKVAGVAGGLGAYAGVDPLIFRILFVVLTVFGGSGLLLYALGWLFIPTEGERESEAAKLVHGRAGGVLVALLAAVALIVGTGFFVVVLGGDGFGGGGLALLVVAAVVVALMMRNGPRPAAVPGPPPADLPGSAGPGTYGQSTGAAYAPPPTPPGYGPPVATPPVPPVPPAPRSPLGRITVSAMLLVVGLLVGWNVLMPGTDDDVRAVAVLAIALGVVGIGLLVGAFVGRARGLIVLGLLLTLVTSGLAAADRAVDGGVGERYWAPTTVAQAERGYRLGLGSGELDLTQLPAGSVARVPVHVGVGELRIVVGDDAVVRVLGHVDAGQISAYDRPAAEGDDLDVRLTSTPDGAGNGSEITVDADLNLGELEIVR